MIITSLVQCAWFVIFNQQLMYPTKAHGINVNYPPQKRDVIAENLKLETFHTVVFTPADGRNKCCCLKPCLKTLFCHIFKSYIGGMEKHSYPLSNDFQPPDDSSACDAPKKIFSSKNSFYPI